MPRAGPRKVQRYSLEFKLKAVTLSRLQGVEVQAVADAIEIHQFMLSKWRKEARDMKRFHTLQRAHALRVEEHALLNKLIRFASARKPTPSRASIRNVTSSA